MHLHNLPIEESGGVDLSVHTTDSRKPVRSKASGHAFQCPCCGYKGPSKRLITKHMKTVHSGQTVNQNMKELHHISKNSHESAPNMRNRVTRNTARDMHWLSQDCLSLPGREFLDKYCSLSNPEGTLEETQQFLVRSAVGETDDQKWTKALQSVLSNFPQDINMHPKLENTMMSNSSKDLTVLMVKNKLKVPKNVGSYVKKTTPPEKLETSPSGSATLHTHCVFDTNKGQPQLNNDQTHCPGAQNNLNEDSSIMAQPESAEGGPIQENRENQELRLHQNVEEHSRNSKELKRDNSCEDGLRASKEPKMANKRDNRKRPQNAYRTRRRRRKAKTGPKVLEKQLQGLGLKLVLKKDPVKNKLWMSQSPLLPPVGCLVGNHHAPSLSLPAMEKPGQTLVNAPSPQNSTVSLKECGQVPETDLHGTQPVEELFSETHGQCGGIGDVCTNSVLVASDGNDDPKSKSSSTNGCSENLQISTAACGVSGRSDGDLDGSTPGSKKSLAIEDVNPLRNNGAISSHAAKLSIPPLGAGLPVHSSQLVSCHPSALEDNKSRPNRVTSKGPFTLSESLLPVAPRAMERTLKLTPLSLGQAVKRPHGEQQPVVVLNHPDADAPQVTRLMEAVHKHSGDVQRVVLSRQTLEAISASDRSGVQGTGAPAPPSGRPLPGSPPSAVRRPSSVRERFVLKLKLRRTSRRKYRVIRPPANRMDTVVKFRCWFCGRVFVSQDLWTAHRQRHLMELKRPNCEES
ncbi:hypothetical protein NHX12_021992 [Muraenolepis orangiensis]|uniref:C2H2-type domain-containing protein n=1 Tax=Muraenolepis orangiensis TaxID=630683 RepID=A0A9Q0ITT6_9TELE|nr:hypothetical protein NHX12_021992 [Muraenolepis orangiensis]